MSKLRLAIVATHPIQYQVPWFQRLAVHPDVDLKVYFSVQPDAVQQGIGFGVAFEWDIPMLEGYAWSVLDNARRRPRLGTFFGSSMPRIGETLRRDRPDAVLLTGWNALPLLQALWACRRLGLPSLVRGESNAMRRRPAGVRLLHRALLSQYDAMLAIGRSNREFYLSNGIPEAAIFDAPYFVDNARFANAARGLQVDRIRLRREWGIGEGVVCFLFVGKLEPKKRPLDAIAAVARVARKVRAHLLIVGSGVLQEEAKALAARENAPVTFAGFLNQTEIPRAYAAADCLVLPSDFGETWGLVVNEAMACRLPAVVSDRVGCGPDLVEGGKTGLVFPFGDVDALASALSSVAGDAEQAKRMGGAAQERVAQYSVERAVQGTVQAVRYAVSRPA